MTNNDINKVLEKLDYWKYNHSTNHFRLLFKDAAKTIRSLIVSTKIKPLID